MRNILSKLSKQKPTWLNRHLFLLILTVSVFIVSIGWGKTYERAFAQQSTADVRLPEYSAYVEVIEEFQEGNTPRAELKCFDQTDRVILGGLIVTLIIISTVSYGYFFNNQK
jgi:hypothetical protein